MLGSASVLLIDDDAAIRDGIAEYLQEGGFRVLQAADGDKGISLQEEETPDVVVCDLRMPHCDGLDVLKTLSEKAPDTPIIIVSGAGLMNDVVDALRLGASDYFSKPIHDLAVLEHAINRCLAQSQLQRENIQYRDRLERTNQELRANLALLEQDQKAGRQVQMRLLPPSPKAYLNYEFSHHLIPSLYLSGDFVEYLLLGERHLFFYIADISGHGASSAFVTALLKNFTAQLRSAFNRSNDQTLLNPAQFLAQANTTLLESDIGKYSTMCVGVIDTESDQLTYSVAGHLPLPVLSSAAEAEFLQGSGKPVGLFKDAVYEETSISLPDSFTLSLFSDGILEILPADTLAEKEQYLTEVLTTPPQNVDELVECFQVEQQDALPDDVALLMIRK